jgi:5-methylcytosine-specific restriction protein A
MAAAQSGLIPQFEIGQEYSRLDDIHLRFGGSRQSGISPSSGSPAIFIFTGGSGEQYGYQDSLDAAGVFSYTGEGQVGDMSFTKGNKAIRDHAQEGKSLYLFEALGKGKPCRYRGEFALANYSIRQGPDKNHQQRKIVVFHLMRVGDVGFTAEPLSPDMSATTDLAAARKIALKACGTPLGDPGRTASRTLYERSRDVRNYVLLRAQGVCESCAEPAPFVGMNGTPYLEAHHTTRLSDGGIDHPRYVAALCPTCHRRVHYGQDGMSLNQSLAEWLSAVEPKD